MKIKSIAVSILTFLLLLIGSASVFAANSSLNGSQANQQGASSNNGENGLKIDIHHILLQSEDGKNVGIREVLTFNNTSTQTYSGIKSSGANKEVLKISLPTGYTNLRVDGISQKAIVTNTDGIVTTSPIATGKTQISLTYEIPYSDESITFSKVIHYPTDELYVLSPKGQLHIKGTGIEDYGLQNMENNIYHAFALDHPLPGQEFSLAIDIDRVNQGYHEPTSGFHSASHLERWYSSPLKNTNPHYWIVGIVILSFVVIVAIGRRLKEKYKIQKAKEKQEHLDGLLDELVIRQKNLLDKIVLMDQKHELGFVSDEEYQVQREQNLNKLIKIKLKIRELETLENEVN